MSEIKVASCTIEELFSEEIEGTEIKGTLEIPEYQRPYVWTEKEINKLLSDIKEHDKQAMYYLGSIILHKHDDKLSIIDGQQRLTTLAIIQYINDTNKVPKVNYASPVTIDNIKKNHSYLKSQKLDDIDFTKLNVTLVVTSSEDDAYTFFETQNTGGVRLSGVDIIKAHHLKEVSSERKRDEKYAIVWEKQKNIEIVVELLIKVRRWNVLNWLDVPTKRNSKGLKNTIIKDFSEDLLSKSNKAFYCQLIGKNYSTIEYSPYKFAIRQPLAEGENFIDYLEQFAGLYQKLFNNETDVDIPAEYFKFNNNVISVIDGTVYLKELYEIAMLCYVNKFGLSDLLEACFWIFRYTYSLRVSSAKVVRENSIPAFLQGGKFIYDIILSCFNHSQLISQLKEYEYEFNPEHTEKDTVKARFINRVNEFFGDIDVKSYDESLKKAIECNLKKQSNNER